MQGNTFLAQILGLLQQNGAINGNMGNFGSRMNIDRYSGQMMQPNPQMGYSMHQYDPQQATPYQNMQLAFPQNYRTNST